MAQETHLALCQIDAGGVLKQLYQHVVAVDLQNTAVADVAVGELDLTQLVVSDAFYSFTSISGPVTSDMVLYSFSTLFLLLPDQLMKGIL